jgi:hypothetical protein
LRATSSACFLRLARRPLTIPTGGTLLACRCAWALMMTRILILGAKPWAKPEAFAEMIEAYFPTLPKIELFARGKARPGWDAGGTQPR